MIGKVSSFFSRIDFGNSCMPMLLSIDFNAENTLEELLDNVAISKVTTLDLTGCRLGAEHTPVITDALQRMKITELSLCSNDFYVVDVLIILAACKGTSLKSLYMGDDHIDEEFATIDKVDVEAFMALKPDDLRVELYY
jgi:hypothetical protein